MSQKTANTANNSPKLKKILTPKVFSITISTLVILLTLVTISFSSLNNKTNSSLAQATTAATANLTIGKVDKGSNFEISVCLQSTSGTMHLIDSSTWFNYDTVALTPNPTIVTAGKFTNLRWGAVSGTKYSLSTVYPGDASYPLPSSLVSTSAPDLVGRVAFNKANNNSTSASITLVTNVFYSTESVTDVVNLNIINLNTDCTILPPPAPIISSSSTAASSTPISSAISSTGVIVSSSSSAPISSTASSTISSTASSISSAISSTSVAQSSSSSAMSSNSPASSLSSSSSANSSSNSSSSNSSSSSLAAKTISFRLENGKPVLNLTLSTDKTTVTNDANDNLNLLATPLLFSDNTPAANYPIQIKVVTPNKSIVIYATKTDANGKLNVGTYHLKLATKTLSFLDNLAAFISLNVEAANSNISVVSGNPSDLNQTGSYTVSLLATSGSSGVTGESNAVGFNVGGVTGLLNTVRSGGIPFVSLVIVLALGLSTTLIYLNKKSKTRKITINI